MYVHTYVCMLVLNEISHVIQ